MSVIAPPHEIDQAFARDNFQPPGQHRCCNEVCDSAIRDENVVSSINKRTGMRTTTIFCEHCTGIYRRQEILEGGLWRMIGSIEMVTNTRDRRAMLARIEERNRTIHIGKL